MRKVSYKIDLISQMFDNYKKIIPGMYSGQVQLVFPDCNIKGEERFIFGIEYYDQIDYTYKIVAAIYNMAGSSKTYLLSKLIPIFNYYGIHIDFPMDNRNLLKKSEGLIGMKVLFMVEQTENNKKNIRLVNPEDYLK